LSFVSLLVFSILFPFYDVTGLLHCYALPAILEHYFIPLFHNNNRLWHLLKKKVPFFKEQHFFL
ncbi:MAG: hypothetical protein ACLTZ8_01905, partial [Mediterraneibacter faecis]